MGASGTWPLGRIQKKELHRLAVGVPRPALPPSGCVSDRFSAAPNSSPIASTCCCPCKQAWAVRGALWRALCNEDGVAKVAKEQEKKNNTNKKKHKHAQPHTHTHWQRNTRVACTGTALSTYRRRTREGGRGGAVSGQRGAASRWCCRCWPWMWGSLLFGGQPGLLSPIPRKDPSDANLDTCTQHRHEHAHA